jgi:hypothetical protein
LTSTTTGRWLVTENTVITDGQPGEEQQESTGLDESESSTRRERSTIRFPYVDLAGAEQIAQAVHNNYGFGSCELDQLAAALSTTTASSTFRQKLAGAGTFGLVRVRRQRVELTDLGKRIVDPETHNGARAEAFLRVPLYRAIFDRYRGVKLPPDPGLESEMVGLGVSTKQTERARQVLQRSAQYAGFFHQGRDRLVQPPAVEGAGLPQPPPPPLEESAPADTDFLNQLHPIIAGLVRMLPHADDKWSPDEQKAWLRVAEVNFAFLYGGPLERSDTVDIAKNEGGPRKASTAVGADDNNDDDEEEEQQPF